LAAAPAAAVTAAAATSDALRVKRPISDVTLVNREDHPPEGAQGSAVPTDTVEQAMNLGPDK
jgi:hypothetical protein